MHVVIATDAQQVLSIHISYTLKNYMFVCDFHRNMSRMI